MRGRRGTDGVAPGMMRIRVLTGLIMGTTMSFLMSGFVTAINTGLGEGFLARWLLAWALVWVIAVPIAIAIGPQARRWAEALDRVLAPDARPKHGVDDAAAGSR